MKGSVFGKMPGDRWQKFAGVRGFYAYTLAHPGKKLSFMGVELGTEEEWAFYKELNWKLLENKDNQQIHDFFKAINKFYLETPALWEIDFDWEGFEWLVSDDNSDNVVVFLRRDKKGTNLLCAINFSPNVYEDYRFGCPPVKEWREVFNTDDPAYGGSGVSNSTPAQVEWVESHDKESSVSIRIPPLGAVFMVGEGKMRPKPKKKTAKAKEGSEKGAPKAAVRKTKSDGAAKTGTKKAPAKKKTPADETAASPATPETPAEKTTKKRGTSK